MNFKPMILSLAFGMLLILMDFNDNSPISPSIGNLDQIFGPRMWYPVEAIYPLASIAVFLLFGFECRNIGRKEQKKTPERLGYQLVLTAMTFVAYLALLGLDDFDDISKVLNLHLILGMNYWFATEAIYPVGSIILFLVFGKIAYEVGRQ
jgi:ABC-type xylose transport system permease subunit